MKKICVTGAYGFIGRSICESLRKSNKTTRAFVKKIEPSFNYPDIEYVQIEDISSEINLKEYLIGCDSIIHCAGIAHKVNDKINLDFYRLANTKSTKYLAEQAAIAGVKRFIFLSSVKVNGESTGKFNEVKKFNNNDIPNPQDNYAISKFEAENALWEIALKTDLEVVIVRLPLVYGNAVKGNLKRLIKLINLKIPLPFKAIKNKRSLIGIDNLIDMLILCIDHPHAAGKTFLVSDGEDLSTPDLIRLIASAMGQPVKLFSLPTSLLKFFSFIFRRNNEIDRLTESLQIDNSYTKKILNWTQPISVEEGIRRMIKSK